MKVSRQRLVRLALTAAVTIVVAGTDLGSKRWAERNLASRQHLLPVKAPGTGGLTVGEAVRLKFPELTDPDLEGHVFRLFTGVDLKADTPAFGRELGPSVRGFIVFDDADMDAFGRRIPRFDQAGIRKWLQAAAPELGPRRTDELVRRRLADVSLEDYLAKRLPHMDRARLWNTFKGGGVFVDRGARDLVGPEEQAVPSAMYVLDRREMVLVEGHLDFSYVENPYGAWGMLGGVDEDVRRLVFYVLSIVAIGVVAYLLVRPPTDDMKALVALGAILGGAVGNLVDRLTLAYVVDFIHMYWGDLHWPRYNVADIGITVGVVVLVLFGGFGKGDSRKSRS